MQKKLSEDAADFALPPNMNIETIEQLAIELKRFVSERKKSLILDVSKIENITTPGLQLILSLEKTLSASGNFLGMSGESIPLASAFKDAGLENLLSGGMKNG